MSSILEQARKEAYREGFSQGVMIAECDCPPSAEPVNATYWFLFGAAFGAIIWGIFA